MLFWAFQNDAKTYNQRNHPPHPTPPHPWVLHIFYFTAKTTLLTTKEITHPIPPLEHCAHLLLTGKEGIQINTNSWTSLRKNKTKNCVISGNCGTCAKLGNKGQTYSQSRFCLGWQCVLFIFCYWPRLGTGLYVYSIYQTSEYSFSHSSNWLLKLRIPCDIHWFAKQNGCAHEQSPFQPSFDQMKFVFYSLGYSLVWYILL